MWLSDTSVKRPVLVTVFCALLVAFGVISFDRLPLREYPDIEPAVVSVTTNYPGASAAVVENKITEIIEDRTATNQRTIDLEDALTLAIQNSRDYQTQKDLQFAESVALHVSDPARAPD